MTFTFILAFSAQGVLHRPSRHLVKIFYSLHTYNLHHGFDLVMERENIHEQTDKSLKWFSVQKFTDSPQADCLHIKVAILVKIL